MLSPSWRTWMGGVQSWLVSVTGEPGGGGACPPAHAGRTSWASQRSCAGGRACPSRATAGGSAWALSVAARSKALLHGPEGWAPCYPGARSGRDMDPRGAAHAQKWDPLPSGQTDVCAERWTALSASLGDTLSPRTGPHQPAGGSVTGGRGTGPGTQWVLCAETLNELSGGSSSKCVMAFEGPAPLPAGPVTWHITAKWPSWTEIQGGWRDLCSCGQVQRPEAFLLLNLRLRGNCISKRGKVTDRA